jgi:hypothetical protein
MDLEAVVADSCYECSCMLRTTNLIVIPNLGIFLIQLKSFPTTDFCIVHQRCRECPCKWMQQQTLLAAVCRTTMRALQRGYAGTSPLVTIVASPLLKSTRASSSTYSIMPRRPHTARLIIRRLRSFDGRSRFLPWHCYANTWNIGKVSD